MIKSITLLLLSCIVVSCTAKKDTNFLVTDASTTSNNQNELSTNNSISFQEYSGTIETQKQINGVDVVSIEHHQQVEIQGMAKPENLVIWNTPTGENKSQIGKIILGEVIDIISLVKINHANDPQIWFNINSESLKDGWIYYGKDDPYANGTWAIIGKYNIDGKAFTVRKLDQTLGIVTNCSLYKHPSLNENELVKNIELGKDEFINMIKVLAITEETDTFNNEDFFWVQIIDQENAIGWVKSTHLSAERGGPLFLTPNNVIDFSLGFEP